MELLDIYNSQHQRTGRTVARNAPVEKDEWLLVIHVCLFNSKGQLLIQKRHDSKDRYPGCWDLSAGGFVKSGEDSLEAALRELSEELGLELSAEKLRFLLTEPFSYVLDDFYLAYADIASEDISFQAEEISAVKWADWDEVRAMLSDGRFVDYDMKLMEKVFSQL